MAPLSSGSIPRRHVARAALEPGHRGLGRRHRDAHHLAGGQRRARGPLQVLDHDRVTQLAGYAERVREVGGAEEDDVHPVHGGDLVDPLHGVRALDVHDHERLLVGHAHVVAERTALAVVGGPHAGQPARPARPVLHRLHRALGIGGVLHPRHLAALRADVHEAQDHVRLVDRDAHDRGHVVELGRAHEVLALVRLERAVLAVEDQEVPALVGGEVDERRIGEAHEAAEGGLALAQCAPGQVLAHQPASSARWRLSPSSSVSMSSCVL